MNDADAQTTRRLLRQRLEDLRRAGICQLPCSNAASPIPATTPPTGSQTTVATTQAESQRDTLVRASCGDGTDAMARATSESVPSAGPSVARVERDEQLRLIADEVKQCQRCKELCATRTNTVFGVGDSTARLCFLGEAPGADEDREGEPFVGRAGQLLNRIIEACTLRREDVYILNILKCRPPGNRNPSPDEAANCEEYLLRQIDIIQPEFICCLGSVAATNLLDTRAPIGRLRGQFHTWRGIQVLATYHPAYLLRNPAAKAEVWKDMQFLMKAMGIELPQPSR